MKRNQKKRLLWSLWWQNVCSNIYWSASDWSLHHHIIRIIIILEKRNNSAFHKNSWQQQRDTVVTWTLWQYWSTYDDFAWKSTFRFNDSTLRFNLLLNSTLCAVWCCHDNELNSCLMSVWFRGIKLQDFWKPAWFHSWNQTDSDI